MRIVYAMTYPEFRPNEVIWHAICRDGKRQVDRTFATANEADAFCSGWLAEGELRRAN